MRVTIKYREFKLHYSDCKTIPGTYNSGSKTIMIEVPEGRMKPSGVRGQHFCGYELSFLLKDGKRYTSTFRAVSRENAIKQLIAGYKGNDMPLEIRCEHVW